MDNKIIVPKEVAEAIAHYVNLADSKTQALTDILSLGYEAAQSEIILRHFDHDYDELMEALICGYEVEKSPKERLRDYYERLKDAEDNCELNGKSGSQFRQGWQSVEETLDILGINIEGVNV